MKLLFILFTLFLPQTFTFSCFAAGKTAVDKAPSFISTRQESELLDHTAPMNAEKLFGTWKLVLIGPDNENNLGKYEANGIANTNNKITTLKIAQTKTSWLPAGSNEQIHAIFPEGGFYNYKSKYAETFPDSIFLGQLIGNKLILSHTSIYTYTYECAFVDENYKSLICERKINRSYVDVGVKTEGFEKINE